MWEEFDEKVLGGKVYKTAFAWCLHLLKYNVYRKLIWKMNMGNEFAFCTLIYFFGQGLKRRQERKDKITKYFPYYQNDRQFISVSFQVIIIRKSMTYNLY